MKQIEELEAEMLKTRSELARMSDEYQLHKEKLGELVLKSAELTSKIHEIKKVHQIIGVDSKR